MKRAPRRRRSRIPTRAPTSASARRSPFARLAFALAAWSVVLTIACSGELSTVATSAPSVDQSAPVVGVPDRGDDPAIVAIDRGDGVWCTGALLAPDVVLTARHCVSYTTGDASCADGGPRVTGERPASSLRVFVGETAISWVERARGQSIATAEGDALCGADIATLALDGSIDDVAPLLVAATGAAKGDHLRSIGVRGAGDAAMKRVRDHVAVLDATSTELRSDEAVFSDDGGGIVLDEDTLAVVGVASRAASASSAAPLGLIDTRTDAYLALLTRALADASHGAVAARAAKPKKGPIDVGANCSGGVECATGACVSMGTRQYCSRPCDTHDHCPAHFRCELTTSGEPVCVAT